MEMCTLFFFVLTLDKIVGLSPISLSRLSTCLPTNLASRRSSSDICFFYCLFFWLHLSVTSFGYKLRFNHFSSIVFFIFHRDGIYSRIKKRWSKVAIIVQTLITVVLSQLITQISVRSSIIFQLVRALNPSKKFTIRSNASLICFTAKSTYEMVT